MTIKSLILLILLLTGGCAIHKQYPSVDIPLDGENCHEEEPAPQVEA